MLDLQHELLGWAASQPALTGAVLFATGVVYAFFGFRLFPFLLAVTCAGLGYVAGSVTGEVARLPVHWLGPAGALIGAALPLRWKRVALALASGATWAALGCYLAMQIGLPSRVAWVGSGLAGVLGALFAMLCYRTTTVILTTLQGTVLMIIGFVALSAHVMPAVGVTFRQWANGQALLIPILMSMLFTTAFSYQAMRQQGDICTGK